MLAKWKTASLVMAFCVSAIVTAVVCNSYLTLFIRIAQCAVTPPRPELTLVACGDISTKFYYSGSLYLLVDKELVDALRAADVVILGNSRTQRTFASDAIDRYFRQKGLRYFVLASEGSGFRFSQMILERTGARPKILMINNESLMVDVLEDTNRDVVLYPDRFSVVLSAFYYSKKLQQWICASSMSALRSYYCHGTSSGWRSAVTGTLYIDLDNYPDPTGNVPVALPPPETRMEYYDFYMKRVRTFLASPSTQDACLINYLIPSNVASVDVARRMAAAMGATFVFPSPDGYYSSDGSHLRPESSERWSTEFTKLADRHVDECMRIGKPGVF